MTKKERALKALEYIEEMALLKCEESSKPQAFGPAALRVFADIVREGLEES